MNAAPATTTTATGAAAPPALPVVRGVDYRCGDCGARNLIKGGDPVRCRQCGFRILYKTRTKRREFCLECWRSWCVEGKDVRCGGGRARKSPSRGLVHGVSDDGFYMRFRSSGAPSGLSFGDEIVLYYICGGDICCTQILGIYFLVHWL